MAQNILQHLQLSLLNVDDCCVQNWNFPKVISPFSRMYLIKGGEGQIIHNHKKYDLQPGKLYLIPEFTLCNYSSGSFLEHFYIHFTTQIDGGNNLFEMIDFVYELPAGAEDQRMFIRMVELNPEKKLRSFDPMKYSKTNLSPQTEILDNSRQIARFIETHGILMQLFSRFIKTDGEQNYLLKFRQSIPIGMATTYISQNLSRPIAVSELANYCHLSNDYFSRLFLKVMGTRPIDFINRKRIESAQLQLITTDDPLEIIALKSGIENISYFNRMFKKYACTTPGDYRRLHRLV
jgi:AraC-like DNA-binding protein